MVASAEAGPPAGAGRRVRVRPVLEPERLQWDGYVGTQAHGNLLQSWGWGELRRRNGWAVFRLCAQRPPDPGWLGAIQVMRQPLGPLGMGWGYAAQGPVLSSLDDGQVCRALLQAAASRLRRQRAFQLKCDPEWPLGPDAARLRRFCRLRPARFDIQQRDTWLVGLDGGRDGVWERLSSSTRRNIRLSQRAGVEVRGERGGGAVATFYQLHRQTVARQRFTTRPLDYYQTAVGELAATVFVASLGGQPLAAAVAVRFGRRLIYLYGGTSPDRADARASFALHWAMIGWGIDGGCTIYDMWGIPRRFDPGRRDHGYALFKTRWGGGAAHYGGLLIAPVLGPLDPLVHLLEAALLRRRPLLR
ncbi:MAG: lipid II:glycine glycyltransferase FemX [Candidatus Dormibacteria bacterium]